MITIPIRNLERSKCMTKNHQHAKVTGRGIKIDIRCVQHPISRSAATRLVYHRGGNNRSGLLLAFARVSRRIQAVCHSSCILEQYWPVIDTNPTSAGMKSLSFHPFQRMLTMEIAANDRVYICYSEVHLLCDIAFGKNKMHCKESHHGEIVEREEGIKSTSNPKHSVGMHPRFYGSLFTRDDRADDPRMPFECSLLVRHETEGCTGVFKRIVKNPQTTPTCRQTSRRRR